ncbi:hypothetical protein [Nonomuraea typhae]|uniref:hypothetical protein n=1 Tax=Nonomuraea typhae TaxID=2603600 RepID=UPI0012F7C715|nr:hypothetical protein [Nonomuraea typhae]
MVRGKRDPAEATDGVHDVTVRKTVTMRSSIVRRVEARTGTRDFSAYVDGAVARALAMDDALEILAEAEGRLGPVSDEAMVEAERAWRGE